MDLFDLVAKITLDAREYRDKLKTSEEETQEAANKMKKSFSVLAAAGVAAFVAIAKSAIDAYGNYEQLVGGSQLMFGDAYDFIAEKAKDAYKTVQMSQNDYLRQVNGFATGLKEAYGGNEKAAAELADKIITAEADVVAATGNTQEAVQNAFNGIMKGNYTMLDNLQLGIKPTKEGFQEVIDKVNAWNEANGRTTNYMIDNLADAQSALVDYIAMQGLAGYAQAEAADTLQGSLASLKSAWENQLNLIGEKLAPAIKSLVQIVANLIENFNTVGPIVAGLAVTFGVFAVAINIGSIIKSVTTAFAAFNAILLANPIGIVVAAIAGLVTAIVLLWKNNEEFRNKVTAAWNAVKNAAIGLKDGIVNAFNVVKNTITGIVKSAWTWGKDLLDNFIGGIKSKIGALVDSVKGVAGKVRAFLGFSEPDEGPLSNFHTYAPDMMKLFAQGIKDNEHLITDQIGKSFDFGSDIANIGLTGNGTANGGTTNTFGAVSISIYPQEGQSADDIAEAVMERIQAATNRRAAALT